MSPAELRLSRSLRAMLPMLPGGAAIPDSPHCRDALLSLQYFLPEVLAELYREWTFRGLDDVVPVLFRKTGEDEAELFGICCFVCDQTLTPLHVRLQVAATTDEISWLECRLGEHEGSGMVRQPYRFLGSMTKRLYRLDGRADEIDWVYKVTFGQRRPSLGGAETQSLMQPPDTLRTP